MRMPQVSERIKEAPAQALRGVFAGIGQLLLITDRLRSKTPADQHGPAARSPRRPETAADTAPPAEEVPEPRELDKTGNVRLIDGAAARTPEAGITAGAEPAEPAAPAAAAAAPAAGEPATPLPNYDELSIASLRARLRNLDVTQVRQLAEYEKAHAARADVIGMLDRRIAKLETEASEDERGEADAEAEVEAREEEEAEVQEEVGAEAEGEE
jgi:hypothetical protein